MPRGQGPRAPSPNFGTLRNRDRLSKKQQKKDARKAEKAETVAQPQQQHLFNTEDLFAANYGDVAIEEIQLKAISDRLWSQIGDLDNSAAGCKQGRTQRVVHMGQSTP
jgi:predicted membrane chloride channel (bestrophin family)